MKKSIRLTAAISIVTMCFCAAWTENTRGDDIKRIEGISLLAKENLRATSGLACTDKCQTLGNDCTSGTNYCEIDEQTLPNTAGIRCVEPTLPCRDVVNGPWKDIVLQDHAGGDATTSTGEFCVEVYFGYCKEDYTTDPTTLITYYSCECETGEVGPSPAGNRINGSGKICP